MPYTNEEGGRLNNFRCRTESLSSGSPTKSEQRNYIFWGVAAITLVGGLLAVAFYASQAG
ncbi:MAG UNVERIFIED_CONTAM: ssl1498 family light-harvesting-like protein [Microcystis novacekii LVE1205-3]|jgi:hypothetical protein